MKGKAKKSAAKATTKMMNTATGGRYDKVFKGEYSPLPKAFKRGVNLK